MRFLLSSGFQTGITESFHLINTVRTSTSILTTEVRKVVRAGADDRVLEALYPLPTGASGQNLRAFSNQTSTQHEYSLAAYGCSQSSACTRCGLLSYRSPIPKTTASSLA